MKHKIEYKKTDALVPYAMNARTHSDGQVSQIAASINEFGFVNPVLVRSDNTIIAGHGRVLAATQLKLKTIPTIVLDHLSDRQVRALVLADNKLAMNAGWDFEKLSTEISVLAEMDFDLSITGFDEQEIDALLKDAPSILPEGALEPEKIQVAGYTRSASNGLTDDDAIPEEPVRVVSCRGDVWLLGDHRLMCGDSTLQDDVAVLMDGQKADMVFTDPPYGINIVSSGTSKVGGGGATKFKGSVGGGGFVEAKKYDKIIGDESTDTARRYFETCKSLGMDNYIIFGGNYFTDFLPPSMCWVVWDKKNTGNFADVELAWVSQHRAAKLYSFLWNGMSREGDRKTELSTRVHPTQKPVGLFVQIFEDFKFDICYDGFGGSGSTLIACEKTGRKARIMEMAPAYIDVIIKRWQDFTGKEAVHVSGKSFGQIAAERE